MKVVILAGGYGTRISEESHLKPKPMIEIGDKPSLWHIMKEYSHYGFNEFIICCGYKQHVIKAWFADYFIHTSDITFDFTKGNEMIIHNKHAEPWKVTVVDTGLCRELVNTLFDKLPFATVCKQFFKLCADFLLKSHEFVESCLFHFLRHVVLIVGCRVCAVFF